jgi:hypothetical protein
LELGVKHAQRFALVVVFLAVGQASSARDICWIDRIDRTAAGVRVFFSEPRLVFVVRPGKSTVVEANQNAPERADAGNNPARIRSIDAAFGDQLRTSNNHDGCTMTVATQGDVPGLLVKNWYMLPPIPGNPESGPQENTKFIAAR